jgi:hypothetical protein
MGSELFYLKTLSVENERTVRTYSTLHDCAVQIRIEKTYSVRLVEKKLYMKIPISAVSC